MFSLCLLIWKTIISEICSSQCLNIFHHSVLHSTIVSIIDSFDVFLVTTYGIMAHVQPFCYQLWKWHDNWTKRTDIACFNMWVNSSESDFWSPAALSLPSQYEQGKQLLYCMTSIRQSVSIIIHPINIFPCIVFVLCDLPFVFILFHSI